MAHKAKIRGRWIYLQDSYVIINTNVMRPVKDFDCRGFNHGNEETDPVMADEFLWKLRELGLMDKDEDLA